MGECSGLIEVDTKRKRIKVKFYSPKGGVEMATKIRYTREFKQEAVKLVKEQGCSQTEAARNLGIRSKKLSRWINEGVAGKSSAVSLG